MSHCAVPTSNKPRRISTQPAARRSKRLAPGRLGWKPNANVEAKRARRDEMCTDSWHETKSSKSSRSVRRPSGEPVDSIALWPLRTWLPLPWWPWCFLPLDFLAFARPRAVKCISSCPFELLRFSDRGGDLHYQLPHRTLLEWYQHTAG
eukprot:s1145_g5.t1